MSSSRNRDAQADASPIADQVSTGSKKVSPGAFADYLLQVQQGRTPGAAAIPPRQQGEMPPLSKEDSEELDRLLAGAG